MDDDKVYLAADQSLQDLLQGAFAKQILVLYLEEASADTNLAFLTKLLAAARIHLAQDTLSAAVPAGLPLSLAPFAHRKQAGHVLVFGLSPTRLGLSVQCSLYIPFEFYGSNWIFCDSLSNLEPDRGKKALLWQALQAMFLH